MDLDEAVNALDMIVEEDEEDDSSQEEATEWPKPPSWLQVLPYSMIQGFILILTDQYL
jgi:hypothetical protein